MLLTRDCGIKALFRLTEAHRNHVTDSPAEDVALGRDEVGVCVRPSESQDHRGSGSYGVRPLHVKSDLA